jgi:K+-sensing histidine kinase KdpD
LDFLIDDNFKVWLIEANTNPCLELACPLLGRIIPNMLENAFKYSYTHSELWSTLCSLPLLSNS